MQLGGGGRTPSFRRPHPNLVKRVVSSITLMICSQICILSICVHHLVFCCPCPRNWWVYMRCLRWTMAMAAKATTSYFIETMKRKKIIRQLALGQIRAQRQGASMHTQLTGISPTLHRHFNDTSPTLLRNSLKFPRISQKCQRSVGEVSVQCW